MNQLLRFLKCVLLFNFREGQNASGSKWRNLGVQRKRRSCAGVYKDPKGPGITGSQEAGKAAVGVKLSRFLTARVSRGRNMWATVGTKSGRSTPR